MELMIFKDMSFKYQKMNDARKLLMERSDIVATRTVFLRTMDEISHAVTSQIYYVDEIWVNQIHAHPMLSLIHI